MGKSLGKVALVGPGAVGGFYGGMLANSGVELSFLFRSTYEAVRQKGLFLVHHQEDGREERVDPLQLYKDPSAIGVCDWVIVAVKSTANGKLEEILSPLVGEQTRFLTLQNGIGNVENLAGFFGRHRTILAGLCFTCINRTEANRIESLLPGYVQFGQYGSSLNQEAEHMVRAFEEANVNVKRVDSLDEALWRKLCWNIPFNGLSIACGGITTDQILSNPPYRARALRLMQEIQAGALAYGIGIEESFLDRQFSLTEPMGAYRPSSLIDYLEGKPVEVETIWGVPLRRALSKGVVMDELTYLYDELSSLTKS
ncbi:2-dehydropantoate 2-reductase [Verrucomicrobia bacterium]|nr:2-dehydropantoate 2-reductase [Verrucomicrobiota bacterium]